MIKTLRVDVSGTLPPTHTLATLDTLVAGIDMNTGLAIKQGDPPRGLEARIR